MVVMGRDEFLVRTIEVVADPAREIVGDLTKQFQPEIWFPLMKPKAVFDEIEIETWSSPRFSLDPSSIVNCRRSSFRW
jgi:hypothetical protein